MASEIMQLKKPASN